MNIKTYISQNNYMLILVKIIVIVYYLSINLYGFFIIKYQKNYEETDGENKCKITDGKLFITGALGGALGIYLAMFIFKFKLTNLFLMVIMPVLITINIYIIIFGFYNNFWFTIEDVIYR